MLRLSKIFRMTYNLEWSGSTHALVVRMFYAKTFHAQSSGTGNEIFYGSIHVPYVAML